MRHGAWGTEDEGGSMGTERERMWQGHWRRLQTRRLVNGEQRAGWVRLWRWIWLFLLDGSLILILNLGLDLASRAGAAIMKPKGSLRCMSFGFRKSCDLALRREWVVLEKKVGKNS